MNTGLEPTRALRAFAHRHLAGLLRRHPDDLMHVDLFLEDLNGPKGGHDMTARLRVKLRNGDVVTVRDTRDEIRTAITLACQRARFAVRRALEGARRIDRSAGRQARRGELVHPFETYPPIGAT